jgi:hypothetical protein
MACSETVLLFFLTWITPLSFLEDRGGGVAQSVDYSVWLQNGRSMFDPRQRKRFSCSLFVKTKSEAHPASYPVGFGGPFSNVKRGRGVTLTTRTHLVPRSKMSRINMYLLSPLVTARRCETDLLWFYFPLLMGKSALWDHHALCSFVCVFSIIFVTNKPIFIKFCTNII